MRPLVRYVLLEVFMGITSMLLFWLVLKITQCPILKCFTIACCSRKRFPSWTQPLLRLVDTRIFRNMNIFEHFIACHLSLLIYRSYYSGQNDKVLKCTDNLWHATTSLYLFVSRYIQLLQFFKSFLKNDKLSRPRLHTKWLPLSSALH